MLSAAAPLGSSRPGSTPSSVGAHALRDLHLHFHVELLEDHRAALGFIAW
jgi:hypothetical protein